MKIQLTEILAKSPVIPVLTIHKLEYAIPLAKAIIEGGISVLEITLRTPMALGAIQVIKKEFPSAVIAAGTVTHVEQIENTTDAGADFLVSPGTTPALIHAFKQSSIPALPGVATPSEAINLLEQGFEHLKLFPAESVGGIPMLKSLSSPLPQITFCPTGGITPSSAKDYLALSNVACVGGSWIPTDEMMARHQWKEIYDNTQEAKKLGISNIS